MKVVGDGPSLPRLKAIARALEIADFVRFVGNVGESALIDLYDSCDLVVLPSTSRREAFGLVQLEASAAGKAVVASDIPGVSDVTKTLGGFLAKPSDVDSLAMQIGNALRTRHDAQKLKGTAASMSWEKVVVQYEELFQSLLKTAQPLAVETVSSAESQAPLPEPIASSNLEGLEEGPE